MWFASFGQKIFFYSYFQIMNYDLPDTYISQSIVSSFH